MEPAETYPRPDFWRPRLQWTSLNGTWDLLLDDEDVGLLDGWGRKGIPESVTVQGRSNEAVEAPLENQRITAGIVGSTQRFAQGNLDRREFERKTNRKRSITVPYVFQCPASGINERAVHEVLWYERQIQDIRTTENRSKKSRLVLRFGAVDYEAKVWVGGHHVGSHTGGHVPFDIDITDAVEAQEQQSYRLTLRVYDSAYDLTQPRGKQYWGAKPESIFYTPSSGIWQIRLAGEFTCRKNWR